MRVIDSFEDFRKLPFCFFFFFFLFSVRVVPRLAILSKSDSMKLHPDSKKVSPDCKEANAVSKKANPVSKKVNPDSAGPKGTKLDRTLRAPGP